MPNLMNARADLNGTNADGHTPLMLCCLHGHREAAELLAYAQVSPAPCTLCRAPRHAQVTPAPCTLHTVC